MLQKLFGHFVRNRVFLQNFPEFIVAAVGDEIVTDNAVVVVKDGSSKMSRK